MSHGIDGAGLDKIPSTNDESDASERHVGMPPQASSTSAPHQQILLGADFAQAGEPGERLDIF